MVVSNVATEMAAEKFVNFSKTSDMPLGGPSRSGRVESWMEVFPALTLLDR